MRASRRIPFAISSALALSKYKSDATAGISCFVQSTARIGGIKSGFSQMLNFSRAAFRLSILPERSAAVVVTALRRLAVIDIVIFVALPRSESEPLHMQRLVGFRKGFFGVGTEGSL